MFDDWRYERVKLLAFKCFISDSCPAYDPTGLVGSNEVISNFDVHFEFSFVAFKWINDSMDEVFVHCDISVCDGSSDCPTIEVFSFDDSKVIVLFYSAFFA